MPSRDLHLIYSKPIGYEKQIHALLQTLWNTQADLLNSYLTL